MKIKHKLLNDFQYVDSEKKIFTLKKGTVLEGYNYKTKTEQVLLDKDIIDSNPEYFQYIDWKLDFLGFIKTNKIPQPSQIHRKMLPFLEQFISEQTNKSIIIENVFDVSHFSVEMIKEKEDKLNNKEIELLSREKILKDKEEETIIQIKRIEKKEQEYKEDLKSFDKKEDELREVRKILTEKQLGIDIQIQELKIKERNIDQQILESNKNIDHKYQEVREKIEFDIKELSIKEKELELKLKEFNKNKNELEKQQQEIKLYGEELRKLDEEIKDWEGLHWKFKRIRKPPSAEQ